MSADLEYYKYHLTDEGWFLGEEKEAGQYKTYNVVGHVYLTITHSSDGGCSGGCKIWDVLDYVDTENKSKIETLLKKYQLPEDIENLNILALINK